MNHSSLSGIRQQAIALFHAGDLVSALPVFRQLCAGTEVGSCGDDWFGLGCCAHGLQLSDEAEQAYRQAIVLGAQQMASAWFNLGNLLRSQGRYPESLSAYRFALSHKPQHGGAKFGVAQIDLVLGRWQSGWLNYEQRWVGQTMSLPERENRERYLQQAPEWQGQPLKGKKILLYTEQGAGDTFQFLRFVRVLRAMGGHIFLRVPPNTRRLLEASALCGAHELALGQPIQISWHCPLLSLPAKLGLSHESQLNSAAYLTAPDECGNEALCSFFSTLDRDSTGKRIGVVWAGNERHPNDARRSMRLEHLRPLMTRGSHQWFSLQRPLRADDERWLESHPKIARLGDLFQDYADTAWAIRQLDLIITVDTSVAHLAGAMGKPVWILLPKVPDWRWLLDTHESPWYPSARLFRQRAEDNWTEVISEVGLALDQWH